jgi:hypothetical protein
MGDEWLYLAGFQALYVMDTALAWRYTRSNGHSPEGERSLDHGA